MLNFTAWADGEERTENVQLPPAIHILRVSYDCGRLLIEADGVTLFYGCEGTTDCTVTIDREAPNGT